MRHKLLIGSSLLLSSLTACGDDESMSPEDRLQGTWGVESTAKECVSMVRFDGNTIELLDLCELEDGSFGAQSRSGTYEVSGTSLTLKVLASSCPSPPVRMETIGFSFVGDSLRLVSPSGVALLEPVDSNTEPGSGAATYGCYDSEDDFTPNPIRPL